MEIFVSLYPYNMANLKFVTSQTVSLSCADIQWDVIIVRPFEICRACHVTKNKKHPEISSLKLSVLLLYIIRAWKAGGLWRHEFAIYVYKLTILFHIYGYFVLSLTAYYSCADITKTYTKRFKSTTYRISGICWIIGHVNCLKNIKWTIINIV